MLTQCFVGSTVLCWYVQLEAVCQVAGYKGWVCRHDELQVWAAITSCGVDAVR